MFEAKLVQSLRLRMSKQSLCKRQEAAEIADHSSLVHK